MSGMTSPENTSDPADRALHGLGMMAVGSSDYITGQEAAGQAQLVHSDVLPADAPWADIGVGLTRRRREGEPTLEDLGFIKGDPVDGDPLFVHATLPEGWTRQGSEHAMWSKILDERGIERVSIFYKAAFYDRSSHAHIPNVGRAMTTAVIYGDDVIDSLPATWELLTEEELAEARTEVDKYLSDAADYSSSDAHAERARALQELLSR